MSTIIRIPSGLRDLCGGASVVRLDGTTVGEVFAALSLAHPPLGARLLERDGRLHRSLNVFVENEDVRFLQGLDTPVAPDQTVSILFAVSGGEIGL